MKRILLAATMGLLSNDLYPVKSVDALLSSPSHILHPLHQYSLKEKRVSTQFLKHQRNRYGERFNTSPNNSIRKSHRKNFWSETRTEKEIIEYCSTVLSSNPKEQQRIKDKIHVISTELPLVVIQNFITKEMCDEIKNTAITTGNLKRSTMGSFQTECDRRTSSTTWLKEQHCVKPLQHISEQVSRLSSVPKTHMENLQVVRYEPGQKFDLHTDHLDSFNELDCRGRLATCLIYLNTPVEEKQYQPMMMDEEHENKNVDDHKGLKGHSADTNPSRAKGGETWFPEYNVKIFPCEGTAVFWFNTVEKPGMNGYKDDMFLNVNAKSRHAGLPVVGGEKWVCNKWIHPVGQGKYLPSNNKYL